MYNASVKMDDGQMGNEQAARAKRSRTWPMAACCGSSPDAPAVNPISTLAICVTSTDSTSDFLESSRFEQNALSEHALSTPITAASHSPSKSGSSFDVKISHTGVSHMSLKIVLFNVAGSSSGWNCKRACKMLRMLLRVLIKRCAQCVLNCSGTAAQRTKCSACMRSDLSWASVTA